MASRGRELKVFLTSDVSKFSKGLKQAESPLNRFKKLAVGALAGVAAAAGALAVKMGVEGVQAAIDDEKAQAKLAKTLENVGEAQDVDKAEDFIEAMMKQTGVADDQLRPAFERLVLATGDTDDALALLTGSLDTAIGSGRDLDSVATAVAKAVGGQTGALKRLIPSLDVTALKGADAAEILKVLNKSFGGQAQTAAETYGGRMAAVATAFSELQESFGTGLLSSLDQTNSGMSDMDDTLYELGPAAQDLGVTFGNIATSLAEVAKYLGPVVDKFNELNNLGDGLLTNGSLVTFMKAINGDVTLPGVVTGTRDPDAPSLTPAQLAGKYANNPTNPDFYAQGGMPRSADPNRYRSRADDADARAAARGTKTRSAPSAS
jgi:hypothetical protein